MADNISLILQTMIDSSKLKNEQLPKLISQVKEQYKLKLGVDVDDKTATKYANQLLKVKNNLNEIDKITFANQIQAWRRVNSAAEKDFGGTLDGLLVKLREIDNKSDFSNLQKQFRGVKAEADALGVTGKSIGDTFASSARKFSEWIVSVGAVMTVVQSVKQMISNVIKLDSAMTELYKVTDETDSKYNQFLVRANKNAQELGRSVSSLVEQTATWAKLGFNIDQAEQLAKISSIYANVGEVDDKTAVSDLVTAMKSFNIESSKSITIVDSLNKLGNEFATDAGSLGEGLRNAASALALGGMDINKSLALLTGGSEITQNAGELGNALKVGQMRVMGMKGALEELGEEAEGLESVSKIQTHILNLTKGQVNIMNDADPSKFKDYYEILEGVSKVFDSLDQTKRADLLETLFGKQRGNQGAAVIQAFQSGQVQKALDASINSAGSAYAEQDKWLDSIDAKLQQLTAAFQSLSNTIIDSNLIKFFVDLGITGTNSIEKIIKVLGDLGTIGAIGGGILGAKSLGQRNRCRYNWLRGSRSHYCYG